MIKDVHWKDRDGDEGRVSFDQNYIRASMGGEGYEDVVAVVETKESRLRTWAACYLDREHAEELLAALTKALR